MNSTSFVDLTIFVNNSSTITIESWFIPIDILMIICIVFAIILMIIFLLMIILDRTCQTVPVMLVANSCIAELLSACDMLGSSIFTLKNDLKQNLYQDSLCIFRAYIISPTAALLFYSFLLQAVYRYINVIYPTGLFWQSTKFKVLSILLPWIFTFASFVPTLFIGEIIYNVDNQTCQYPLRLSFSVIYILCWVYMIPMSMIMFIYYKLVRYVKEMSKNVKTANTLLRAQRELNMVRRTVILVMSLITVGFPYALFMFMSFLNRTSKYHFRIAFLFSDAPLLMGIIILFQFTDPIKTSLMKRIKRRSNVVVARVA